MECCLLVDVFGKEELNTHDNEHRGAKRLERCTPLLMN